MIRAPRNAAYRIPSYPYSMRLSPHVEAAHTGSTEQFQLVPAIPMPLLVAAHATPAVAVPCERLSGHAAIPSGSQDPVVKFHPITSSTNPLTS